MDIIFQELAGEFSVVDVVLCLTLSFILNLFIGWIYKITHKGTSYSQNFVVTLVMNGMVVALVMMVIGSNIARAFSLVGALSIVRFRNAVKETRDVGFIFFSMAIGMATGTKFYLLAAVGTVVIGLIVLVMTRLNWFARESRSQVLRVAIPNTLPYDSLLDALFLKFTSSSELISVDSIQGGMLTELTYSIGIRKADQIQPFLNEIKSINGNHKVTLITGYQNTDL